MSKGGFQNPKYANQSGTTSGYGSQGNFGMGYTQPYGSPGTGTYDPMLGFGQASGMGTTYNYPTRYSADYTRYAQSGQPFNPAVMGYNSYGQISAQRQRQPPSMGKGGGGFQPQPPAGGGKGRVGSPGVRNPGRDRFGMPLITGLPQRPPTVGGKGGPQPENDGVTISYPGGSRTVPRNPQRRDNQFDITQPAVMPEYAYPTNQLPQVAYEYNQAPTLVDGLPVGPVAANRPVIDENIYNSPFGQLIGQPAAQPTMQQQGANISNPDRDRAREITTRSFNNPGSITAEDMAFLQEYEARPSDQNAQAQLAAQQQQMLSQQREISDRAPPGMMRNPNYSPAASMLDNAPMPGSEEYLRRQQFIPADGGFGRMAFFQEGGQVPPDAASNMEMMLSEAGPANPQSEMAGEYDRLIQMTMQAVLGQTENADEIIQMFIDEFGVDAFRQLRDAVLKQQVPGAQTEGMVDGNGGGMDDQVMGMIGNQRPVAVSPGEYIVPADVVSGLGDGSSKAGADMLDELNQAVRMARTGTTQQPRPLMETMQQ